MKARGEFVYKGLEERAGGEFVNEKGQTVKYDSSYVLKVDEVVGNDINERKLKIDKKNVSLVDALKKLNPYAKIVIECDVILYSNNAKVVPVAICDSNNK